MKIYRNDSILIMSFLSENQKLNLLSVLSEDQLSNLDSFLLWLSNYNKSDRNFFREAFKNLKQNDLSNMLFYLKLRSLYFKSKGKDKADSMSETEKDELSRQFLKNMTNLKVKNALLSQSDLTSEIDCPVKGLVAKANFYQQRYSECTSPETSSSNLVIPDYVANLNEQIKNLTLLVANSPKNQRNVRFDLSDIRCYGCGRLGHKISECRSTKKKQKRRSRSNGRNDSNRQNDSFRNQNRKRYNSGDGYRNRNNRNDSGDRYRNRNNSGDRYRNRNNSGGRYQNQNNSKNY